METPLVRLVILNFDGGDDVLTCVERILAVEWPADRLEVIVVDNASTDGSPDEIATRFPQVRLIRNATNTGFPANNLGLAGLDGVDFVGLVNNDAFVEPTYLGPLVDALTADRSLGAACPKILLAGRFAAVDLSAPPGTRLDEPGALPGDGWLAPDDLVDPRPVLERSPGRVLVPVDGPPTSTVGVATDRGVLEAPWGGHAVDVVNNVGNEVRDGWFGADRGLGEVDSGQYDVAVDVFAWCGAAVLFPAAYIRDVGGFDERLFLYYEDLDLAWRGRARGWRYRTVPSSVVRHRLGASSTIGSRLFRYYVERNRLVVLAKNAPVLVAIGVAVRFLLATGSYAWRDVVGRAAHGRRPAPALAVLRLRAFAGYLRLLPHALRQRRAIRRSDCG